MKPNTCLWFAIILFGIATTGCKKVVPPAGEYHNPYNVPTDSVDIINSIVITDKGTFEDFKRTRVQPENFSRKKFEVIPKEDKAGPIQRSKISPLIDEWLKEKDTDEFVEVIVTLKEDMRIPLLPDLSKDESREEGESRRSDAIAKIRDERDIAFRKLLPSLQKYAKFEVREQFWLVNAFSASIKLGSVLDLTESKAVVYIQAVDSGEKPPDADATNDVDDARRLISSDPYFNLGLTNPWIGLLDTGVLESHNLFNSPDHIAWMRDCVNGGTNCNDTSDPNYDPSDFSWNHGTSSAAIITGNNRLGNAYRGVTAVRLDSWQIYTAGGLNSAAAVRAMQAAVAAFDKVIVGEIQANESETGAIATAADNAYDAGAIIVAANGNFGPLSNTVRSPAIAHKVIGVGGFMTTDQSQYNNQGRGSATDGRYKPDIQAPTWSETASNASDTALRVFTGTSGATPYASGAAMLARNWLRQFGTFDNGQTYAFMILYGQDPYPYDNTEGAGDLRMATNGWAWWGKLVITDGLTIDIPINISAGKQDFDGSLWWPESASQAHNDIDIHLIDPFGTEQARGYSGVSVFERAEVAGSLAAGLWKLRIRGYWVRTGAQVVYWAAHVRN